MTPMPSPTPTPVDDTLQLLNDTLTWAQRLAQQLPTILTRLALAAGLVLLGVLVIRLGRRVINASFRRKHVVGNTKESETMRTLLISVFNYIMYFAILLTALSMLGIDVSSILTVAGVGGIAIGFGAQTLVKDIISGFFLWIEDRLKVGDVVTVGGQTGTVEGVALRTTVLRGTNGNLFVIPNGDIRTVINMSRDYRNALVDITIAHGQDFKKTMEFLQEEMDALHDRLEIGDEAPQVLGIISIDGRAATVRIECKCDILRCHALEREIRLAALSRMTAENVRP